MSQALWILIIAFIVRLLNLYSNNLDVNTYLVEDQIMYWNWSLKNAYTLKNTLDQNLLLERMPGSFLFFQIAIWLVGENLFKVLIIQILIDSINCLIIAAIAKVLDKKLFFVTGIISAFSPLLIIISSQILSDTIFLFFFGTFILFIMNFSLNKKKSNIYFAGIFLSLSLFTRVVAFPLIFFTIFFIAYIYYKNKVSILNITKVSIIFLFLSSSFILPRMVSNYYNYNTLALTTQSGSHFAFWVIPGVLDFVENDEKNNYKKKLFELNHTKDDNKNPFEINRELKNFALNNLFSLEKKYLVLSWIKGATVNIFSPAFLIDKRIRDLDHPSFYENDRNLKVWLYKIFYDKKFNEYKVIFLFSLISSLSFLFFTFVGLFILFKYYKHYSIIFVFLILYFLSVTGPVYSPKYIHPIMPVLIIIESLFICRICKFISKFFIKT